MKPIRFYHWWIYRLFHWTWNPLLRDRPTMTSWIAQQMIDRPNRPG